MRSRQAGFVAVLSLAFAACQPGAAAPGASQAGATTPIPGSTADQNPPETEPPVGAVVTGLDGIVTWASDGTSGPPDAFKESHQKLSVNVHLVDTDGSHDFVDSGSTYTYSETNHEEDAQTLSLCGYHGESTGSGSGAFTGPDGRISGFYASGNTDVVLDMQVPYANTSSGTDLCNGQTIAGTAPGYDIPDCGDPAGIALVGKIEPGTVTVLLPGQTIDFTCSYAVAIGVGTVVATGSLTTR